MIMQRLAPPRMAQNMNLWSTIQLFLRKTRRNRFSLERSGQRRAVVSVNCEKKNYLLFVCLQTTLFRVCQTIENRYIERVPASIKSNDFLKISNKWKIARDSFRHLTFINRLKSCKVHNLSLSVFFSLFNSLTRAQTLIRHNGFSSAKIDCDVASGHVSGRQCNYLFGFVLLPLLNTFATDWRKKLRRRRFMSHELQNRNYT